MGQLLSALGAGLAPLNESNADHSSCLVPVPMQCYGPLWVALDRLQLLDAVGSARGSLVLGTLMAAHPLQQLMGPQSHAAKACPNQFPRAGYFKV